jgi:excisionase family DNA binding protein
VVLQRRCRNGIKGGETMENKTVLIDAKQMARLTSLPISSIWRGCRDGSLPHYRLGRVVRFDASEVLSFLRRNTASNNPQVSG